jgi:hypothetical protein
MSTEQVDLTECPTPIYHETHYYCPSCSWREQRPSRRDRTEEAIVAALRGVTLHVRKSPGGDDYWSHTPDANSLHKLARIATDAALAVADR